MTRISDSGRGVGRRLRTSVRSLMRPLGLAAAAMLVLSAAPIQRAEALSLINPGAAPTAKAASGGLTTEVHGGHGGHGGGGGGGGVHIGGFHGGGGGAVFHGGAYRAAPVFHGSGIRYAGVRSSGMRYGSYRYGGYRFAARRHFHHRRFFGAAYYAYPYDDYPYYYSYRRCHIVWTYSGPRRVCHYPHWRHHHGRHHHHRHHHHRIYG